MQSEILAKAIRGSTTESVHRGHLYIIDGEGKEIVNIGDTETLAFIRSSAKPFQVLPFLIGGGADHFGFSEAEIALACASHSGEKIHTALAEQMLEKIGLTESDLRCGAHLPFNEQRAEEMIRAGEQPTQLHNNCSGKHAAMLGLAKFRGEGITNYNTMDNPIQTLILSMISVFTEIHSSDIPVAIDGCCAPNFALPVRAMAKAFLKLVIPSPNFTAEVNESCRRVREAMMNHPELVGGTERLDTLLMTAGRGKFISKIGAEGVWLCGVLPSEKWKTGLGIAMKIEDGDDKRARAVVSVEVLRQLGIFEENTLKDYSPLPIKNRRGDHVGRVEASLKIFS